MNNGNQEAAMSKKRRAHPKLYKITTFRKFYDSDGYAYEAFYTAAGMNRNQALQAINLGDNEIVLSITCLGRRIYKQRIWKTTEPRP